MFQAAKFGFNPVSRFLSEAATALDALPGVAGHPIRTDRTLREQAPVASCRAIRADHAAAIKRTKVTVLGAQV
jgi:hypothetical protein